MKLPIRLRIKHALDRFRRHHVDGYVDVSNWIHISDYPDWSHPFGDPILINPSGVIISFRGKERYGSYWNPRYRYFWMMRFQFVNPEKVPGPKTSNGGHATVTGFITYSGFEPTSVDDFLRRLKHSSSSYSYNHKVYLSDDQGDVMVDISMTADIVNPRFGVLGSQAKTNGNQYFFEFALNCEDDGTVKGSSGAPGSLVFDTPPIIGKAYRDINPDNRLVLSFDSGGFYTLDLGNSTSVSQTGRNLLRQFDRAVVEAVCSDILLGDTTGLLTDSEKVWNTAFLEDTRDSSDPSTKDEWMYDLIMQEYNNVHPRVSADANGVKSMIDMASGSLSITSLNVLRRLRFRTTSNYRARLEYFFTFGLTTLKSENLNGSSALLSDYSKNWPLDQITESNFPINIGMDDQPIFVNLVTEVKDWGNILCPPSSHGQVSTDAYLYPIPYVFQRTSDSGLRTVFTNTSGTFGGEHVPYGHLEMIDEVYNSKSQYVGPQVLEDHYPLP